MFTKPHHWVSSVKLTHLQHIFLRIVLIFSHGSFVSCLEVFQPKWCVYFLPHFSSSKCPCWLWGPCSLLFNVYQGSFPGVKWPGREVNHSPASSAKIKNEWSYTSAIPICHHGMDRENFIFYHLIQLEFNHPNVIWTVPILKLLLCHFYIPLFLYLLNPHIPISSLFQTSSVYIIFLSKTQVSHSYQTISKIQFL
jgi:hypothetical protein